MKKIQLLMAATAVLLLATGCEIDRKKVLTVEQLPPAAQMYIEENMPDAKVLYVKKEQKNFKTHYEVRFDNRIEYEFDSEGEIVDIEVDD